MSADLLPFLLSNIWSILLVVVFFGGSVFVHELGHYWAARWRGAKVERFSIGFGPKIKAWQGRDGVEYRISWLPLGGYVALPQLVDLGPIEGEIRTDLSKLPPLSYSSKMIISAAGAFMNIVFAFLLACIIWIVGQPMSNEMASTTIGYVSPSLELSDGSRVSSPAVRAGLLEGDRILAIDGVPVDEWYEIMHGLMTGSGRSADGNPTAVFRILRQGKELDITVHPQLTGAEKDRRVGIAPGYELIVHSVEAGSAAEQAGFKAGDRILSHEGAPVLQIASFQALVEKKASEGFALEILRDGQKIDLRLPPATAPKPQYGFTFTTGFSLVHTDPFTQIWDQGVMTFRTLGSLINPGSDIGLSKMAGPVGIVRILHSAATAGMVPILLFTILINVSLAIFNLLPIPVLDGGHMLFATLGKLRGKALPINFIATAQGLFMVLLLTMVVYVSFFDVRRMVRDFQTDKAVPAKAP